MLGPDPPLIGQILDIKLSGEIRVKTDYLKNYIEIKEIGEGSKSNLMLVKRQSDSKLFIAKVSKGNLAYLDVRREGWTL